MATTLDEIKGFLQEEELKFRLSDKGDFIRTGFGTKKYQDKDGDKLLTMIIELYENGEFLRVFAPGVYGYKDGPHKLAVLQACMYVNWKTKMVQFEYDPSDGEIRATIEFPLEDAKLTRRQLVRVIRGLVGILDDCDPIIRGAIEDGKFEDPDAEKQELFNLLRDMVGQDPARLREILAEVRKKRGEGGERQGPEQL